MTEKLERDLLKGLNKHLKSNGYGTDHTDAIKDYTESSVKLNISRLHGLPLTQNSIDMHNRLSESAFGSPHEFHVYTGSQVDLGKLARSSKDGILHLPAHLSTSLYDHVAGGFGDHISKIRIRPNDKILPAFGHGLHENEREVILPAGTRIRHINPHQSSEDHMPEFEIHSIQHVTPEELQGSNKNVGTFLRNLNPSKPKEAYAATQYLTHHYQKTDASKTVTSDELSDFKDSLVKFQNVYAYDSGDHLKAHQALMEHPNYDFDDAIHNNRSGALTGALLSSDKALKRMGKSIQKDILAKNPELSYLALPKKELHPDVYDHLVDDISRTGRHAHSAAMSPHMKPHHIVKIADKLSPADANNLSDNENFCAVLNSSSPHQKATVAEKFQDHGSSGHSFFSGNPLDRLLSSEHFGTSENHLDIYGATDRDILKARILHNSPHINDIAAKHPEVLKRTDDLSLNSHLSARTRDEVLKHVFDDAHGNHDLFIRSLPKEKHDEFLSNPLTPQHVIDSTLRSTLPEEWSSENHSRAMKLALNGDQDMQKRILKNRTHHAKSVTSAHLLRLHGDVGSGNIEHFHQIADALYSHPSFSGEDLHKVLDDFHTTHEHKKYFILHELPKNPNLQPSHIDRITNGSSPDFTAHLDHPNATGDNIVKYMTRQRGNFSKPDPDVVVRNIDKLTPENIATLLKHASKTNNNILAREVLKSKNVSGDVLSALAHIDNFSHAIAEHPNTPASVLHSFANDPHKGAAIQAMANVRLGHRTDSDHLDHNVLSTVLRYGTVTDADKKKIIERSKSRSPLYQDLASHPAFSSDMLHDAIKDGVDLSNIRNNPNLTSEHTESAFSNSYSNADIFKHLPPGGHLGKFQGTSDEWRSIMKNPHLTADHITKLYKDQEFLHPDAFSHPATPAELKRNIIDEFIETKNETSVVGSVYKDKTLPSSVLEAASKVRKPSKYGGGLSADLMNILSIHPNVNPRTLHNLVKLGSNNAPDSLSEKALRLKKQTDQPINTNNA